MTFQLNENIKIGKAALNVKDLDKQVDFYTNKVGFKLISKDENKAKLGVGDKVLLELKQITGDLNKKVTGLYHIAYLLPTRADLGNSLLSLVKRGVNLTGASDHGYSEALYLDDPEGNGIEIYADKPKSYWKMDEETGRIDGYTIAMHAEGVLADRTTEEPVDLAEGTTIGHMHLSIKDLEATKDFYTNTLGLQIKSEFPRQAVFMAGGMYHHQVAINIWNSAGMVLREDEDFGLNFYEILLESRNQLDGLKDQIKTHGFEILDDKEDSFAVKDNQNIKVVFKLG